MAITLASACYALGIVAIFVAGLRFTYKAHNEISSVLRFFIFGGVLSLFSFSVIYTFLPFPDVSQTLAIFGALFFHLTLIIITALLFACTGVIAWRTRHTHPYVRAGVLALFLSGAEYLRAIIIPSLFAGEGTLLGVHFSGWSYGVALTLTPFIEYAYFGGIYALCFILALVLGVFVYTSSYQQTAYTLSFLSLLVVFIHFYTPTFGPHQSISYALIGTKGGALPKETVARFLEQPHSLDIIITPEDTRFLEAITEEEMKKSLGTTLLLDATSIKQRDGVYNTSLLYDPRKNRATYRNKGYLFPFGEYVPSLFMKLSGDQELIEYAERNTYIPGNLPDTFNSSLGKIGALLCSEIYSHASVSYLKDQQPHLVIAQSSLRWFHERAWALGTYELHLRLLAATLRTPVLASSHHGPTYQLDTYGRIIERSFQAGAHIGNVDKK